MWNVPLWTDANAPVTQKDRISDYVPGTTASIQGMVGPLGGRVVVSWVPVTWTSVDLAASQPESSMISLFSAIRGALESSKSQSLPSLLPDSPRSEEELTRVVSLSRGVKRLCPSAGSTADTWDLSAADVITHRRPLNHRTHAITFLNLKPSNASS